MSESKTNKLYENIISSDFKDKTIEELNYYFPEMKDLVFLTRQMEDIDREKLELNDLKNWISQKIY